MKVAEIRGKSADELKDQLIQLKKEQFNLRFQKASGQLETTGRVRQVRRDIARVMTVMGKGDKAPAVKAEAAPAAKPAKAKRK